VLSANDEMETMVTGIKHGACDYFVKPVRLEHVRNIWMHVVRKNSRNKISNVNDDAGQKLQHGDDDNAEKDGANHTGKHSKKSKKVRDDADKDKDKLTQKKQRIHWSGQLHRKFVEAINQIGMDSKRSLFIAFLSTWSLLILFFYSNKIFCYFNFRGCSKENSRSDECGQHQ